MNHCAKGQVQSREGFPNLNFFLREPKKEARGLLGEGV